MPRLPRKVQVDVVKCHTLHAEFTSMFRRVPRLSRKVKVNVAKCHAWPRLPHKHLRPQRRQTGPSARAPFGATVPTDVCILRGSCGIYGTGLALVARLAAFGAVVAAAVCVAGVALGSLCVAGVALGDIGVHSAWQAWLLYGPGLALVARLGPAWRRCRRGCLCGRCGTW